MNSADTLSQPCYLNQHEQCTGTLWPGNPPEGTCACACHQSQATP